MFLLAGHTKWISAPATNWTYVELHSQIPTRHVIMHKNQIWMENVWLWHDLKCNLIVFQRKKEKCQIIANKVLKAQVIIFV